VYEIKIMKAKLVFCFALVLSGVLAGYFVAAEPESANRNGFRWGEIAGGFQMATSLDESNGIVHCRIRNATTNEMDYPSFDFGYFVNIHLEIREATNWTKLLVGVFPGDRSASGGCPYLLKRSKPGQIITDTYVRDRDKPWPVWNHEDYLKWSPGNTNEALLTESLNKRLAARKALLTKLCHDDTFAFDLIWEKALSDLSGQHSVEARVSQKFRMNKEKTGTLYSPVFILDGSLIQTYIKQNRDLFGK